MENEAQTILKMIEGVDPSDADALDEIDARVTCLLLGLEYHGVGENNSGQKLWMSRVKNPNVGLAGWLRASFRRYTRSRDALKSIRPDGGIFSLEMEHSLGLKGFRYMISIGGNGGRSATKDFRSPWWRSVNGELDFKKGLTEELAELHAIIQAIEWKRENE